VDPVLETDIMLLYGTSVPTATSPLFRTKSLRSSTNPRSSGRLLASRWRSSSTFPAVGATGAPLEVRVYKTGVEDAVLLATSL
jgi:hypothetical protein